jgi:DNA-binding MarR family transcriptional regulator
MWGFVLVHSMAQDDQLDLRVEEWLSTLGIESLCQWDMLVFLDRHPSVLVSTEYIARFLGYATAELSAALDSLKSSGLVEHSRVSQGVRLYQVTASPDPSRRDALERLMAIADDRAVRLLLARRLRSSDRPERNKNDFPLRDVQGDAT